MGLFEKIFGQRPEPKGTYGGEFRMLDGYVPHFTRWGGSIYESELIRAAINARATHISKLDVRIQGAAKPTLQTKLAHGPNEYQTWSQFMYRLSTILDVHNTAFIVPVYDIYGEPSGIYAPLPRKCEVVQYNDVPYLRYEFSWGDRAAIELDNCGVMTKMQYRDDLFGESNHALLPTMDLIKIQNQGIEEGVKNSASFRFWGRISNYTKASDLALERKRFSEENFSKDAQGGGLLLFPYQYTDLHQIESKPFIVAAEQMAAIKQSVYDYFGVNEDVLTNKAYGDAWAAFYEGCVEPFAIQFSEVMTRMLFTYREQSQGSYVMATSNRIQYMSNSDKLAVSAQMADRGLMTRNEIREIWNLPPLPDDIGNQLPIRGEYYNVGDDSTDEERDQSV